MSKGKRSAPEGFVYVRAHHRRKPTASGGRKLSGWTIAALVAGIWLWGQVVGFGGSETEDSAPKETPISESADR